MLWIIPNQVQKAVSKITDTVSISYLFEILGVKVRVKADTKSFRLGVTWHSGRTGTPYMEATVPYTIVWSFFLSSHC